MENKPTQKRRDNFAGARISYTARRPGGGGEALQPLPLPLPLPPPTATRERITAQPWEALPGPLRTPPSVSQRLLLQPRPLCPPLPTALSEAPSAPRPEEARPRRRHSRAPRWVRSAGRRPGRGVQAGPTIPVTPDNRAPAEARLPARARRGPHPDLAAYLGADFHGSVASGEFSTSRRFAYPEPGAGSQLAAPRQPQPPPLLAARSA